MSKNYKDPFDKSFKRQYKLALKIGEQRFGSSCKHEKVSNGRCQKCLRKVIQKGKNND